MPPVSGRISRLVGELMYFFSFDSILLLIITSIHSLYCINGYFVACTNGKYHTRPPHSLIKQGLATFRKKANQEKKRDVLVTKIMDLSDLLSP